MKKTESKVHLKQRKTSLSKPKSFKWQGWIFRALGEAILIILVASYLFYDNFVFCIFLLPYIFVYIPKAAKDYEKKRQEKLALEFRDGMQAVVSALTAGYSIENAFKEAVYEIKMLYGRKNECYKGFSKIVHQLNLNTNIEVAFEEFARESRVEEISNFSEVLSYAKRSGGNLVQIIRNTTDTISEKIEVKREINTIISAKKLEQKIMNLVPIAIIMYMRLTSAGMFDKLYGNMTGIIIMTICLGVYVAAKLIADKIVDIQV